MKTSDKLLLGTVLGAMLLFGGASLAVYARYKNGNIISEKEIYRQNHLKKALPAPLWLRIKGINEVHFIAADTFAIEYEKEGIKEEGIIRAFGKNEVVKEGIDYGSDLVLEPRYTCSGDTLIIDGDDPRLPPLPSGERIAGGVHSVNVYGLKGGTVELGIGNSYIDGDAVAEGDSTAGSGKYRFLLKQNRLKIGQDKENDVPENTSYIRSLAVSASDFSGIELHPGIRIGDLRVELDSISSFSAGTGWNIGKIHVEAKGQTQMILNGSLLNKIMADDRAEGPAGVRGRSDTLQK
jgi:hypothetical protein